MWPNTLFFYFRSAGAKFMLLYSASVREAYYIQSGVRPDSLCSLTWSPGGKFMLLYFAFGREAYYTRSRVRPNSLCSYICARLRVDFPNDFARLDADGVPGDPSCGGGYMVFAENMRVRLTQNVDKDRGFVNGALGVVHAILRKDVFVMRMDNGVRVLRSASHPPQRRLLHALHLRVRDNHAASPGIHSAAGRPHLPLSEAFRLLVSTRVCFCSTSAPLEVLWRLIS